jgi:hypothetical protein
MTSLRLRGRGARARLSRANVLILVAVFAGSAVFGAYADWLWWMPYNGILITLAALALFLLALALATAPRARALALALMVGALGLLAGQNLGPARPELRQGDGHLSVTITAPSQSSGEHLATCASHIESGELQVSGDPNLRLDILPDSPDTPADVDDREIVGFYLTVGDRWDDGPSPRADNIRVSVFVSPALAKLGETRLTSGPESSLDLAWTETGGTLRFAGLRAEEPTSDSEVFERLAGTATWTCS